MDALRRRLHHRHPGLPGQRRTVFKGHLFVGDVLLSDSGMRNHPLTPMTDANLVRVLQAQTHARKVGLIDHGAVARGADGDRASASRSCSAEGVGIAIVDAVSNDDLLRLGPALADMPLVTRRLRRGDRPAGELRHRAVGARPSALPPADGLARGRLGQLLGGDQRAGRALHRGGRPALRDRSAALAAGDDVRGRGAGLGRSRCSATGPVLVYSHGRRRRRSKAVQARLGVRGRPARWSSARSPPIARGLVERGVRQLVVAGGETSGACVQALGITQLRIGPQIDPGVPWCHAAAGGRGEGLHLALKSGNFGSDDFFTQGLRPCCA